MKEEKLIDAIGNIDDSLIEETAKFRNRKKTYPYAVPAAVAACIMITAALLPWNTMLGNNTPTKKPISSDTGIGILQNNETTDADSTKESNVTHPDESAGVNTNDTSKDEDQTATPTPETKPPYQSDTQGTDTSAKAPDTSAKVSDTSAKAPDTSAKVSDTSAKEPDTSGPSTDYNPNVKDEETTGPVIPNTPAVPDPDITVPSRPTVLSRSVYPQQTQYSISNLTQWRNEKNERINYYKSGIGNTFNYMFSTVCEFFSNSENENLIYSPVNIYMTLGMLAETTSGNSRSQILSLLGKDDIYSVRSSAYNLWNSCYRDDGVVTTVLGSSIWLDNSFTPDTEVTDILAESYYASSFWGNTGDEKYNEFMRSWLNEQTNGLLSDTVADKALDPNSAVTLMPTVYFKALWEDGFDKDDTTVKVFHSADGNVKNEFMEKENYELYYEGESFTATRMTFTEGEDMWFILPDEGVSPLELFLDYEAMCLITCQTQETLIRENKRESVVLSLPKFDISSEMDLVTGLKNLGITDVFDKKKADFSALTDSKISVGEINHTVRMRIDENGFEAATVSDVVLPSPLPPDGDTDTPIEFTLDRPFIFVITSDSGLPLFVGMVNRPN